MQYSDDCRISHRKTTSFPLNKTSYKTFSQKIYNSYVGGNKLQKLRECLLIIARMINTLHAKFDRNFTKWILNSYRISIKYAQLVYGWAPHEISVLRIKHCQYWKYIPLILLYYKNLKLLQTLKSNSKNQIFLIVSDHCNIMMTAS